MPPQKRSLLGYDLDSEHRRIRTEVKRMKMSQRWSTTIGWRSSCVSQRDIVEQAKSLCGRYLRIKLRSCITAQKKLGLQRLKSVSNLSGDPTVAEVFVELRQLIDELEKRHPKLYQSVIDNVGLQAVTSEIVIRNLFLAISQVILGSEITWGRIVALYAVAGSLAVDCVRLGHPEFVLALVQDLGSFVERELCPWIAQQGGWKALLTRFKKSSRFCSTAFVVVFIVSCVFLYTVYTL